MNMPSRQTCCARHRGTVLIATILVVFLLASLVIVFARQMRVEANVTAYRVAEVQTEAIVRGAVQYVIHQIDQNRINTASGGYEQAEQAVEIGDGLFWIIRPNFEQDDDLEHAYGIVGENSKVNINTATQAMLSKLPGMTEEMAAAIIDWRDPDATVSPNGAESEYYLLLDDPYESKNAPFETLGELELVRGADADILYGEDANLSGVLDATENDADDHDPPDNADGRLDRGIYDFITVYSRGQAESGGSAASGDPDQQLVSVNTDDKNPLIELLSTVISDDRLSLVTANIIRRRQAYQSLIEFYITSGLQAQEFDTIVDRLTTAPFRRPGLINVNTAPREVLFTLQGLDEADVEALIAARQGARPDSLSWVVSPFDITRPQLRQKVLRFSRFITNRSWQYSADIVAVSGDGRAYKRYRVIVDAAQDTPRVIRMKDLSHMGWPLDPQILNDLRSGVAPSQISETLGTESL